MLLIQTKSVRWEWVGLSREKARAFSLGLIMKTPCFPKPKVKEQNRLQYLGRPAAVIHVEQAPRGGAARASLLGPRLIGACARRLPDPRSSLFATLLRVPLILPGYRLRSLHPGWSSWVIWSCSWRRASERMLSRRPSSKRSGAGEGLGAKREI